MSGVIRPEKRTDEELKQAGFKQYKRKKQLTMARQLPEAEAPLEIKTSWGETLIAEAGHMICYAPGDDYYDDPNRYDHWPVEAEIFKATYEPWDEIFQPTRAEKQLQAIGCKPYYKAAGVWAKKLDNDVYIQGLEHEKPVLVPKERVLAIGHEGEPYDMGTQTFYDRYDEKLKDKPRGIRSLINRLVKFFKRSD